MICGFKYCNRDSRISEITGKFTKYCCDEHSGGESARKKKEKRIAKKELLGLGSLSQADTGRDVVREVREANAKHIQKALKGNVKSQEALKTQGLTYHFNKDSGEWGKGRSEI